jgi:hypothetical protein
LTVLTGIDNPPVESNVAFRRIIYFNLEAFPLFNGTHFYRDSLVGFAYRNEHATIAINRFGFHGNGLVSFLNGVRPD